MKKELISKHKLEKLKKQFTAYANRMVREAKVTVEVEFAQSESYTYFKNKDTAFIQIGVEDAFDLNERSSSSTNSFPVVKTRLEGFLNHEIGHLLYSQFERKGYCEKKEQEAKLAIALIGKDKRNKLVDSTKSVSKASNYDDQFWKSIVPNIDVYEELKACFVSRVYWHNMGIMLNMVEDAAIECRIPAKSGLRQATRDHIYGCIASSRNHIFNREISSIEYDRDLLRGAMFEFHEFGVIGYRMHTPTPHLNKMFVTTEVEKLYNLAMYSKWNTNNSEERYVVGRVVLDMFKPWIEEKAMEHLSAYMTGLYMSQDPSQIPDMGGGMPSEVSISMPNETASGSHNQRSEYDYDIPDEMKKEIQQEQEKVENEGRSESSESSDSNENQSQNGNQCSQDQEGQAGSPNDGQESNSSPQGKKSDTPSGESNSQEDQQPGSNAKGGSSEEKGDASNRATSDDSAQNSQKGTENESYDEADSSESSKGQKDIKAFGKNISKPLNRNSLKDVAQKENKLAEQAVRDELQKTAAQEDAELKDSIKEQTSNMRKQVNKNQPAECNNDFHKGIPTIIETQFEKQVNNPALKGQAEDKKMSVKVASEINLLKMYDKRAKTKIAKNGRLNSAALYRAMTDQKCFKKVTPGKKKNFRVALLMDLSGSMHGSKITNAIRTAYVLANSCIKSNVPVSVWGHNYYNACYLYKFLDYNQKSPKLLDNIYHAVARGSNQDGLAIFQVAHDLVAHKHADEELVLIVLSDGAPAGANSYYGIPAENDIKKIVGQFKKLFNVHTIGVTIETCRDEIESCQRIYGDNAVVVKDSSQLALETVNLLKELICN